MKQDEQCSIGSTNCHPSVGFSLTIPPYEGYRCRAGEVNYRCGYADQPPDPCASARWIFGPATCLTDVVPSPPVCPTATALNSAFICVFRAPREGYWCAQGGFVYGCGGLGQPADPCATARGFVGNAICLVDGVPVPPPEALSGYDICPVAALGIFASTIIAACF